MPSKFNNAHFPFHTSYQVLSMLTEPLRTHIRHGFSVLPQTWWSPQCWMKACLQLQPEFCSREKALICFWVAKITGAIEIQYLSFLWRANACLRMGWRVCVEWLLVPHSPMGGKQPVPTQMQNGFWVEGVPKGVTKLTMTSAADSQ